MKAKRNVGEKLGSQPIISDSNCTRICVYMSLVLLGASLIYELTGFAYADIIGTAGLIYFSINEGKEALEKAKNKNASCEHCGD
jgi:divalent metal cation (Fe/Co/Zn/Cd) transporter